MSCDFAVWFPHRQLSNDEAGEVFGELLNGEAGGVQSHPSVDAFYKELTSTHPEITALASDQLDDHDLCPWSGPLEHSPGHVLIQCVWSKADYVTRLIYELAKKHGLAIYDPQAARVVYPDASPAGSDEPWWHYW